MRKWKTGTVEAFLLLVGLWAAPVPAGAVQPVRTSAVQPVGVSADGHWPEYRGRKVLLIGDSVTQGWMELGKDFNQEAYINALAARGINVLMLWSYIGITDQTRDPRIGYDAPEIWPWARSGSGFDLNRFDPAYFDRLRALVVYAAQKGIVVLITVHDGWTKTRFAGHPFNQALGGPLSDRKQYVQLHDYKTEMPATFDPAWDRPQKHQYFLERFCDRLIQTTADQPNVLYEMFNEGEWYNPKNLRAFEVHFLSFFKARTARPLLVNADAIRGAGFRGESACDVISYHQPNWTTSTSARDAFNKFAPEFAKTPAKPFFFTEPVPEYQGGTGLFDALMRLMWGTAMSGAGFVVQNDTSFGFAPRTKMALHRGDRDVVLDLEGHCARFFNAPGIDLDGMSPQGALASGGVCLARPGKEYVVYSQNGESVTVDLSGAAGQFSGRFYNPRKGLYTPELTIAGGDRRTITKPTPTDWVLHLVSRSRHYPATSTMGTSAPAE